MASAYLLFGGPLLLVLRTSLRWLGMKKHVRCISRQPRCLSAELRCSSKHDKSLPRVFLQRGIPHAIHHHVVLTYWFKYFLQMKQRWFRGFPLVQVLFPCLSTMRTRYSPSPPRWLGWGPSRYLNFPLLRGRAIRFAILFIPKLASPSPTLSIRPARMFLSQRCTSTTAIPTKVVSRRNQQSCVSHWRSSARTFCRALLCSSMSGRN